MGVSASIKQDARFATDTSPLTWIGRRFRLPRGRGDVVLHTLDIATRILDHVFGLIGLLGQMLLGAPSHAVRVAASHFVAISIAIDLGHTDFRHLALFCCVLVPACGATSRRNEGFRLAPP